MLYLEPNTINTVNVTLWENSTNLINPYFTWKLTNKQSFAQTIFYASDFSQVPWYYNSFTISTTTGAQYLTAGVININPGEYTYQVFQMNNPYDLNLANAVKEVETGILILSATYSPQLALTQSSGTVSVWLNMDRV